MTEAKTPLFTPVLVASCVILLVGFGIRASFGLFQIPIAEQFGWPRAEFSLAIAIQNLAWGFGQPIFAALAERFGDRRAIVLGALTYALGPRALGLCGDAGRAPDAERADRLRHRRHRLRGASSPSSGAPPRRRTARSRSASPPPPARPGRWSVPPLAEALLAVMPWSSVFLVFAALILATLLLLPLISGPARAGAGARRGAAWARSSGRRCATRRSS